MVQYSPYDWAIHEDPYPTYEALREQAPVYYNEQFDFWALSRHADVLAALRDPAAFSSSNGVALEAMGPQAQEVASFLAMDPPRHDRLRGLVSRGFTPRRVASLEPEIRRLAKHYLDPLAEQQGCDLIADFAGKLPMDVISEMVGVVPADRDTLRGWADTLMHREPGDQDVTPAGMQAAGSLLGYFAEYLGERKKKRGTGDLVDALLDTELDGDRLSDKEIIAFLFLSVIAGNETTTKLIGNATYWLWRHPDQRALVRDDPGLIAGWVEETLRFDASSQMVARTLTKDLELHGCKLPAQAKIALLIGSANRDPRAFDEPDHYDVRRRTNQSLAFGNGTHFCLGASLARLEGRVALEEMHARFPNYEIDTQSAVRVHSSNVRGFTTLPITF